MPEITCFVTTIDDSGLSNEETLRICSLNSRGELDRKQQAGSVVDNSRHFKDAKGELAEGKVLSADGRIKWDSGKGYVAEIDGRQLKQLVVYPGNYRFNYLPKSGLIMSGTLLNPLEDAEQNYRQVLADANGFNLGALPNNRDGRLDDSQKSTGIGGAIGMAVLFSAIAIYFFYDGNLFLAVAGGVLGLVGLVRVLKLIADSKDDKVEVMKAIVNPSSQTNLCSYDTEKKSFEVNANGISAIIPNTTHLLYYKPRSGKLVNIEPVHGETVTYAQGELLSE